MSAPEHGATIDGVVRQSTLRTFDACPQAALWETQGFQDWSTGPQALGTAFHMVMEAMLRTLAEQDEDQMPTQEAVEIMYEVIARPDCPHLTDTQMRALRIMVLNACDHRWTSRAIVGLEERLWAEVPCPDGKARRITGKPDVIMGYGSGRALVIDFKSGWAMPPEPRRADDPAVQADGTVIGEKYLSERGHFQLDTLGLLVMRTFPKIDHVVLREFHARLNATREAELARADIEHVERRLGVLAQRFEEMMMAGEAEARPGTHCSYCPRPTLCPIPAEERREGAIEDEDMALQWGHLFLVVDTLRDRTRAALKAWIDAEPGRSIDVPGGYIGWRTRESGSRAFGVHKEA